MTSQAKKHKVVKTQTTEAALEPDAVAGTVVAETVLGLAAIVDTMVNITVEATNSTTGCEAIVTKIPAKVRGDFSSLHHELLTTFVFSPFTALVVAVTSQASIFLHSSGMAGTTGSTAMKDSTSPLLYARFRV